MLAFGPGLAAWGLVTGVAMTQSGLGVGLSILMSLTVYAGSAQLASLPLLASGAPMWVIWASAFCVNLRFVIFSSQWRVHLGHLPRRRRLVLGYLLADLNLVVFQKAWPDRDVHQTGQAATPPAARPRCGRCGRFRRSPASCCRPSCRSAGASASPARCRCSASPIRCSTTARAWVAAIVSAAAAVAAFALPLKLNILVAIAAAVAASLVMAKAGRPAERAS